MCLTGGAGWSFVGATAAETVGELHYCDSGLEIAAAIGGYGDDYWDWDGVTSCA
jgi:hypothetical protein